MTEAISNRYKIDVTTAPYSTVNDVGVATVIESIVSLYITLVDYGEATIKSDVKKRLDKYQSKDDYKENTFYYYR